MGNDPSAACGGISEVSEWQRSNLQAPGVSQRRKFGHRNRSFFGDFLPLMAKSYPPEASSVKLCICWKKNGGMRSSRPTFVAEKNTATNPYLSS